MSMPSSSVVSSPRRLRPRTAPSGGLNVDPTSDSLGYAGGNEARIALEKQANEEANTESTTKKVARGLVDGMRKVPRAKSILKYPRGPMPPPGYSSAQGHHTDLADPEMDPSYAPGPSGSFDYHSTPYHRQDPPLHFAPPAQSNQTHGETWEGTTMINHDPPTHVHQSRPAIIDMDNTTSFQKPLTEDYKRMPVEYYEPALFSFARLKDFIMTIHKLPWVASDRITVDYYPGRGTRISSGLTDMTSQSDVLSSPSFSLRPRRRPVSSWFMGGSSKAKKGGMESLDLAASPEHAHLGSPNGSTVHATPRALPYDAITRHSPAHSRHSPAHSRVRSADAMTPLMPIIQQIVPSPPGIAVQSPTTSASTNTTFDSSDTSTPRSEHTVRLVQTSPVQPLNAGQQYWFPPAMRGGGPVIPSGTFTSRSLDSTESSLEADFTQPSIDPRTIPEAATRTGRSSVEPSNTYIQGGGGAGIYGPPLKQADTSRHHAHSRSGSSTPIRSQPEGSARRTPDHDEQYPPRHRYVPEPQNIYLTSRHRADAREEHSSSPVLPASRTASPARAAGISRDRPEGNFMLMNSPQPPYVPLQFSSIDGMHAREPMYGHGYIDR